MWQPEWEGIQGRMDTCICIAETLRYSPETITVLLISYVKAAQSCPALCDPMDYTVHGIPQARILEWVACPFSSGSSNPGSNPGLMYCKRILDQLRHKGSPRILQLVAQPFSKDLPNPGIEPGSPALQADSKLHCTACIPGRFNICWGIINYTPIQNKKCKEKYIYIN